MKRIVYYLLLIICVIGFIFSFKEYSSYIINDAGFSTDYDSSSSYSSSSSSSSHSSSSYDSRGSHSSDYGDISSDFFDYNPSIEIEVFIVICIVVTFIFLIIKERLLTSNLSKNKKILFYLVLPIISILLTIYVNYFIGFIVLLIMGYFLVSLKWIDKEVKDYELKYLILLLTYLFIIFVIALITGYVMLLVSLLFCIIMFILLNNYRKFNKGMNSDDMVISTMLDSKKGKPILPAFNNFGVYGDDRAVNKYFNIFYEVQMAWMNFDYDKLKMLCSDELYNTLRRDLETLEKKKQKNIMKDFEVERIGTIEVNNFGERIEVVVILEVLFYDYIINTKSKMIVRGTSFRKVNNRYSLTFQRRVKMYENCPSCGAKVVNKYNSNCEFCGSILINNNEEYVLSLINKVN